MQPRPIPGEPDPSTQQAAVLDGGNNEPLSPEFHEAMKQQLLKEIGKYVLSEVVIYRLGLAIDDRRRQLHPNHSAQDEIYSMLYVVRQHLGPKYDALLEKIESEVQSGRMVLINVGDDKQRPEKRGAENDIQARMQGHQVVLGDIINLFRERGMTEEQVEKVWNKALPVILENMNTATPVMKGGFVRSAVVAVGGTRLLNQVLPLERFESQAHIQQRTREIVKKTEGLRSKIFSKMPGVTGSKAVEAQKIVVKELVKIPPGTQIEAVKAQLARSLVGILPPQHGAQIASTVSDYVRKNPKLFRQ